MGLALVTKANYKAYAALSSTNEDAKIDILIPQVSELVKSLCNNSFIDYVTTPAVEIFEGGTNVYVPLEGPVIAVTSLERSIDNGSTYTALTNYVDYAFSKQENIIKSVCRDFKHYINGYRLTYTAGYSTLPADLSLAIMDLITYYLKNDAAVHSTRPGFGSSTVQIEYITNTKLPAHISRVLDLYANTYN